MGVPLTYNLRNLAERKATTLMTAIGIGLTVAVLITSVAMTAGMNAVFSGTGHPLQVLGHVAPVGDEFGAQFHDF